MFIKCKQCGYTEETNKDFFVKVIGGAMPVGGYWAWTTYLFAGTGFAMAIVVAIITGGIAMLAFKDEIVEWLIDQKYKCSSCGSLSWEAQESVSRSTPLVSNKKSSSPKIHLNNEVRKNSGTLFLSIFEDDESQKQGKQDRD